MTPESSTIAELRVLLDALCEETITPEQLQRLEELVLTHPEAEAYYVQYMSFYADLVRNVAGLATRSEEPKREPAEVTIPTPASAEPARPAQSNSTHSSHTKRRRVLIWSALGVALAASVLVALTFWPRTQTTNRPTDSILEPTDETVAVLLQTHNAVWEETGMPTRPGSPLPPGRLVLKSGYAQIEFYNGATVILQGRTEFRIVSRIEGYCASGKLRATVPPQAHGFRIGSPSLSLVDRGTEFGLDVGDKTAVHVFKGEVDLYSPDASPTSAPLKKLLTDEAVSIQSPGVLNTFPAKSGEFLTAKQLATEAAKALEKRKKEWTAASAALRLDPSVVVYYTFEEPGSRTLLDVSPDRKPLHDGAVVGCSWGNGRWRGRQGLEFKRMSDRVRLNIPGEFSSLTFATWCRPDALPNTNNSLLMADNWDEGECHWQIGSDGTLILGIKGPPGYRPEPNVSGPQYRAPGAITPARFGQWIHLAVTYN
ncbi:MAG: FecR domain-containing protein, partial [Planctomycetia bacterium]|nr:FecR domain-containing protein [Planctomycetia bacterium]